MATGKVVERRGTGSDNRVRMMRPRRLATASSVSPKEPKRDPDPAVRTALSGTAPLSGTPAEDYLRHRGLELETKATRGLVGFAPRWAGSGPAVVFACTDTAGRLVALQGRFLALGGGSKAISYGPISHGVFATPGALAAPTLAIAEAPIDALSLWTVGVPAVALFGCAVGDDRGAMLRKALAWKTVLLATDNDAAGEKAAGALRNALAFGTRFVRLVYPQGVKDANEWLLRDRPGLAAALRALDSESASTADSSASLLAYAERVLGDS